MGTETNATNEVVHKKLFTKEVVHKKLFTKEAVHKKLFTRSCSQEVVHKKLFFTFNEKRLGVPYFR
jgi:hypothetical protein